MTSDTARPTGCENTITYPKQTMNT